MQEWTVRYPAKVSGNAKNHHYRALNVAPWSPWLPWLTRLAATEAGDPLLVLWHNQLGSILYFHPKCLHHSPYSTPSAEPSKNLHDISPSFVKRRQTANIFTNPDCNLILQRGRADKQSPWVSLKLWRARGTHRQILAYGVGKGGACKGLSK